MKRFHTALASVLIGASVAAGCVGLAAADDATLAPLVVNVGADGKRCVVLGKAVSCAGLAAYMRDTLKVPLATRISVEADVYPSTHQVLAVFSDLALARYKEVTVSFPRADVDHEAKK